MRPTVIAVFLTLFVLAGCLSFGGATPVTVTPAPVPAAASDAPTTVVDIPTHGGAPVATLGPDGPDGEVPIPTHGGEPVAEV